MSVFDFFKGSKKKDERDASKRREHSVTKKITKSVGSPQKEKDEIKKADVVVDDGVTPHISEKATALESQGVYIFKVASRFNRVMVKQHVAKKYKVTPRKVTIANMPSKEVFVGRRRVHRSGFKKAMVYLREGDTIIA